MKIYVVHGFGYDISEASIETYAIVCTTREDANNQLAMIIEDHSIIAKSSRSYGIEFIETLRKKNGEIIHWKLEQIFDLRKSSHTEEFLYSTLVVGGNIKLDEFHPVINEGNRPEFRIMPLASVSIREQEIISQTTN